jgi:hypothetical protein
MNAVWIPVNAVSNPALSQQNALTAVATVAETVDVAQAGTQSAEGRGIAWDETGTQTASVDQSGAAASSAAEQTGHENTAGWNGTVRSPEQAPAAEQPTLLRLLMVQPAEPALQDPFLRPIVTPPDVLRAARRAHGRLHVVGKRLVVARPAITIRRLAPAVAAARPPAATRASSPARRAVETQPSARAFGSPRRPTASLGAGSAPPAAAAGGTGATSRPFMFAVPGVGRPQPQAPAPGLPVDALPPERPG